MAEKELNLTLFYFALIILKQFTNNMLMKKKDIAWLFAVIVLSVLLAISIFLGVTGYFSSVTYVKSNSDLKVGETVSISVLPNQANVASFTFDGAYLPNELIPQVVQINGEDLNSEVHVRVKAKVFGESSSEFSFVTSEHFEEAEDGYFYFDDTLKGGNKITFCTYLVMPKENKFVSGEKYILSFIVETLDVSNDLSIWKTI